VTGKRSAVSRRLAFPHCALDARADGEGVEEHAGAISQDVDFGLGGVEPADGELCDAVAEGLGEKDDFDIEGEAVDGLEGEDFLGGGAAEGFEAALGIAEGDEGEGAEDAVEGFAHGLAQEALAALDAAEGMLAGAEEDIVGGVCLEMGEKNGNFFERNAEIRVHVEDDVSPRLLDAGADGVAFAAMDAIIDDVKIGLFCRSLAR
jgi:hypothetical protein